ncbi:MAG: hypothetical protein KDD82_17550 [Planctomycetes bacterium]|nr:hypothetical protein [Planctomycetota bacterium]
MKRSSIVGLLTLVGVLCAWGPSQAEDAYSFYMRKDLARELATDPDKLIDKTVTFTDELAFLWPEADPRPSELDGQRVRLFHTVHFRCVVPEDAMGEHLGSIAKDAQEGLEAARAKLEDINRRLATKGVSLSEAQTERTQVMDEVRKIWHNAPLVTVFGRVTRAHLWGPPHEKAAPGAETETITIVVERIEKPRERWYQFGLDAR